MNIYELILDYPYMHNMQIILEIIYSSQNKLIVQSCPIREHGKGYWNLAFAASKGQERPIFSFNSLKCHEGVKVRA